MESVKKRYNFKFNLLLLIIFVAPMASGLSRDGFLALFPFIKEDFNLTRTQIGFYSTFLFASSSLFSILSGRIVDTYGSRIGMLTGISVIGIFISLHSLAPAYFILLIFAFVVGFGHSLITPAASKAVMTWYSREERTIAMGIVQSGSGAGGLLGAVLFPVLGTLMGWRKSVILAGFFCTVIGPFNL